MSTWTCPVVDQERRNTEILGKQDKIRRFGLKSNAIARIKSIRISRRKGVEIKCDLGPNHLLHNDFSHSRTQAKLCHETKARRDWRLLSDCLCSPFSAAREHDVVMGRTNVSSITASFGWDSNTVQRCEDPMVLALQLSVLMSTKRWLRNKSLGFLVALRTSIDHYLRSYLRGSRLDSSA